MIPLYLAASNKQPVLNLLFPVSSGKTRLNLAHLLQHTRKTVRQGRMRAVIVCIVRRKSIDLLVMTYKLLDRVDE